MSRTVIRYRGHAIAESTGSWLFVVFLCFALSAVAAWITHVIWIIRIFARPEFTATLGNILLGIFGVCVPPVGMIHGFMIWIGVGYW